MMICVYLVTILSTCRTRVVLQGIIHVCNFFFNHNVYKMIIHVFSSWVCDLLDIMKINLSKLVKETRVWHGLGSHSWVRAPSKATFSRKLHPHCLVPVGSRNGFASDLHKQKVIASQSN